MKSKPYDFSMYNFIKFNYKYFREIIAFGR